MARLVTFTPIIKVLSIFYSEGAEFEAASVAQID
jgi:hypothetical protein